MVIFESQKEKEGEEQLSYSPPCTEITSSLEEESYLHTGFKS